MRRATGNGRKILAPSACDPIRAQSQGLKVRELSQVQGEEARAPAAQQYRWWVVHDVSLVSRARCAAREPGVLSLISFTLRLQDFKVS
jgi:hypothetical protein